MELEAMDKAGEGLISLLDEQELPVPPVPPDLMARMRAVEKHIFATRDPRVRPYDLGASVSAALADAVHDERFALVGIDGYGVNSWALHYFVVTPGVALFLQFPWGGIYVDAEQARRRIDAAFGWAKEVQERMAGLVAARCVPDSFHLAAMVSDLRGAQWAFAPSPEAPLAWTSVKQLRPSIDAAMDEIATGKFGA